SMSSAPNQCAASLSRVHIVNRSCPSVFLFFGRWRVAVFLLPFLAAQWSGYEHTGQALRFCLSFLVKIKAVPARTSTANLLKLRQSCLLASIHRLVIRSSLSSRSA